MPAQLVALTEGPSILLDKPILLLGRHPECDIQIDSRKISRRHCCIAQVGEHLVVRDLGSTNGIRINGIRVLEGRLKAEDELTIGGYRYRVSWDPLAGAGARPAARAAPPRARAAGPEDDDILEACDEPVPLPDPVVQPVPTPRRRQEPEASHTGGPASNGSPAVPPSPPPAPNPFSSILPDRLDLTPASDAEVPGGKSPWKKQ